WHHIAWTCIINGSNFDVEIFLNGTSIHTGSGTLPTAGDNTRLCAGTSIFGGAQRLNGALARAIVRTGDRSASFAARAANTQHIVADGDTVGFWNFGVEQLPRYPSTRAGCQMWVRGDNPLADFAPNSANLYSSNPND